MKEEPDSLGLSALDFRDNYRVVGAYLLMRDSISADLGKEVYTIHCRTEYGSAESLGTLVLNYSGKSYSLYPNSMSKDYTENYMWSYVWSQKVTDSTLLEELVSLEAQHNVFWKMMGK